MNTKKLFMIIVLIAFFAIIGVILVNINKKSVDKVSEESNNTITNNATHNIIADTTNAYSNNLQNGGNIRKSAEKAKADLSNIIEITDNFFIEQTNDVYYNLDDYIGKTIKIEGLIYSYEDSNGDICYAVVRNTPGCCGNDGLAGLDIRYDEDYPEENTWVEIIGVVGTDNVYDSEIPVIQVYSINIKEKGTVFVTN